MFFEPSLISDLWFSVTLFFVFLLGLHLILVFFFPLSELAWKKVDYVWLAFASLSLIAAVTQDRQLEASAAYNFSIPMTQQANGNALENVKDGKHYNCDMPFHRTEFSPPNFDWVVQQKNLACLWFTGATTTIQKELASGHPNLRPEMLKDDPRITDDVPRSAMHELYGSLAEANSLTQKQDEWRNMSDQTDLDFTVIRLSPILLAFALALRITKVTGEIRIARKRTTQSP